MTILDTNVLSAVMRTPPDPTVVAWLDRQPAESVWLTSLTVCETRFGLAGLPNGRRRRALEAAFTRLVEEDLENRVLDFDGAAATSAAVLAADRRRAGRPVDVRETLMAGIALARHATLATRNVRHFADLKVPVVDPWTAETQRASLAPDTHSMRRRPTSRTRSGAPSLLFFNDLAPRPSGSRR